MYHLYDQCKSKFVRRLRKFQKIEEEIERITNIWILMDTCRICHVLQNLTFLKFPKPNKLVNIQFIDSFASLMVTARKKRIQKAARTVPVPDNFVRKSPSPPQQAFVTPELKPMSISIPADNFCAGGAPPCCPCRAATLANILSNSWQMLARFRLYRQLIETAALYQKLHVLVVSASTKPSV